MEETKIWERRQSYFSTFFSGERSEYPPCLEDGVQEGRQGVRGDRCISEEEAKVALRKMKSGKAIGSVLIPVEIWKCLGEEGLVWLTELLMSFLGL